MDSVYSIEIFPWHINNELVIKPHYQCEAMCSIPISQLLFEGLLLHTTVHKLSPENMYYTSLVHERTARYVMKQILKFGEIAMQCSQYVLYIVVQHIYTHICTQEPLD